MLPLDCLNVIWSSSFLFPFILLDNTQDTMSDLRLSHPLMELEMFPLPCSICCTLYTLTSHTPESHFPVFEALFVLLDPPRWWINTLLSLPWINCPCLVLDFPHSLYPCLCVNVCVLLQSPMCEYNFMSVCITRSLFFPLLWLWKCTLLQYGTFLKSLFRSITTHVAVGWFLRSYHQSVVYLPITWTYKNLVRLWYIFFFLSFHNILWTRMFWIYVITNAPEGKISLFSCAV